jgi:predicted transcriptional regulator
MNVLFSIKPEFVDKIFSGEKKYEYRKIIFKRKDIEKIIIYATKPIGEIVGEFDIGTIISAKPEILWHKTKKWAGITYNYFEHYFSNKENGYAIQIYNALVYSSPIKISDVLSNGIAPQSFCYLNKFVGPATAHNRTVYASPQ